MKTTFDFRIIGEKAGKALIKAVADGALPPALSVMEISFLEFPYDADRQRDWAGKIKKAIASGDLKPHIREHSH